MTNLIERFRNRWPRASGRNGGGASTPAGATSPNHVAVRLACLLLVGLAIAFSLMIPPPPVAGYVVGQIACQTVLNERAFSYEDAAQTQLARDTAAAQVPPVFQVRPVAVATSLEQLEALRKSVAGEAAALPADLAPLVPLLPHWTLIQQQAATALRRGVVDPVALNPHLAGHEIVHLVDDRDRKIHFIRKTAELPTASSVANEVAAAVIQAIQWQAPALRAALAAQLARVIQPNVEFEPTETRRRQDAAAAAVPPVRLEIPVGVPLIRIGEPVTADQLARLTESRRRPAGGAVATADSTRLILVPTLLLLLLLGVASVMLDATHRNAIRTPAGVILIATILILQIVANRVAGNFLLSRVEGAGIWLVAALPLSLGALLLSNLVGLRVAVWTGIVGSFVATFQFPEHPSLALLTCGGIGSVVGSVLMRKAHRRYQVIWAGLGLGACLAVVAGLFQLAAHLPLAYFSPLLAASLLAGLACALLAAFVSPLFEYAFGITTDLYLLELSDLNHPLLKRLQMEAPGTYHHSLVVATLAEETAAAIGANPLLARVCAYFHDIGKLNNPDYFTENGADVNPHDDLKPNLSKLVIQNHVKTGLELAARYKLRQPLCEAIAQHHGTSLVAYFYHRAVKEQQLLNLDLAAVGEQDFRYPGPLPQRKEVVILSLADTLEAATRSLEKPTSQKIRALVEELVQRRIEDGQLNQADLTFHELTTVKETIIRTLTTMHHGRVKYPKADGSERHDPADRGPAPVEPPVAPTRP